MPLQLQNDQLYKIWLNIIGEDNKLLKLARFPLRFILIASKKLNWIFTEILKLIKDLIRSLRQSTPDASENPK
jgi:hypothetical protein